MSINETEIKTLAREECGAPGTDEVSASLVDNALKEACRAVNRRMSRFGHAIGSITTQANVQKYSLPSDCIRVLDLFWGPSIATVTPPGRIVRVKYDFAAIEIGEELRTSRRRKIDKLAYQWDVFSVDGIKYLFLGDVPAMGGNIIKFTYLRDSEVSASIPDGLEEALKEYVKAIIFRTRNAWQSAHEALTDDAELRMTRAENFARAAEASEKKFQNLLSEKVTD